MESKFSIKYAFMLETGFLLNGAELATAQPNPTLNISMLRKFFFRQMTTEKQVQFLKRKGVGLGTRLKEGRKIYIYMLNDLFVEVHYKNDNSDEAAEKVNMISGLMNLNQYLERDFRASF